MAQLNLKQAQNSKAPLLQVQWCKNIKGNYIKLSTLNCKAKTQGGTWGSCIGNNRFAKGGIQRFEVSLKFSGQMLVGVTMANTQTNNASKWSLNNLNDIRFIGNNKGAWGFNIGDGSVSHDNKKTLYPFDAYKQWEMQDVLSVELDTIEGKLTFRRNNVILTTVTDQLFCTEPFFPACSIYNDGKSSSITLLGSQQQPNQSNELNRNIEQKLEVMYGIPQELNVPKVNSNSEKDTFDFADIQAPVKKLQEKLQNPLEKQNEGKVQQKLAMEKTNSSLSDSFEII